MIIDVILGLIFISSTFALWYSVSEKLPQLIAIPDRVITERFHEDSARLRLFILNIKTWYREQQHQEALWRIYIKILYRLHIFLMRLDNGIVELLKGVREGEKLTSGNGSGDYWKQLQQDPISTTKDNRIREVRVKK